MRNRTVAICALVACAVFVLALAGTLITLKNSAHPEVEVLSDGKVIYSGPAQTEEEPVYIPVESEWGMNLVRIDAQGTCVEMANCEGQECVHMGYLKNAYLPVVCLPHRLVIRFTSGSPQAGLDAVSE